MFLSSISEMDEDKKSETFEESRENFDPNVSAETFETFKEQQKSWVPYGLLNSTFEI